MRRTIVSQTEEIGLISAYQIGFEKIFRGLASRTRKDARRHYGTTVETQEIEMR